MRRLTITLAAALAVAGAGPAEAQKTEETDRRRGDLPPGSAAEVADAPRPGDASGVAVPAGNPASDAARWIPRVLLFVPRWTYWLAMQPVRGGAWAYERYQLKERFFDIFFNEEETFGVYPVAFFETGFGLNVGARLIARDLLGEEEGFRIRAGYGGRFRQTYNARLTSGDRLEPVEAKLEAELDVRNKERFFGIGNGDRVDPGAVMTPVDALDDDTALASRYRATVIRVDLAGEYDLRGPLSIEMSTGVWLRSLDDTADLDGDRTITDNYQPSSLVGFEDGLSASYSELELIVDTRRRTNRYLSEAVISTGWLASAYLGASVGFGGDDSRLIRYGFDLQRFFDLYHGNRVLWVRLFGEGVTGPLEEIPFLDLPRLGGDKHLRGYPHGRFRDRVLALATAEYQYDLHDSVSAYLFADAGRVWRRVREIDGQELRVGFGAGFEIRNRTSFLARAHVASSIDGGLFFNLAFDPIYDARTRLRK